MTGIDYAQQDPRWKNLMLGGSQQESIGLFGCLVVAGTAVATALGHNITPDQFNDQLKSKGCFGGAQHSDINSNDFISKVFPDIQYVERKDWRVEPADLNYFNVGADVSTEIIVLIDSKPSVAGLQQHWCRVIGKQGDDVVVVDSWDGKRIGLAARYCEGKKSAAQLIYAAIKYHKAMVAQGQVPVAAKTYVVRQGDTLWQIALNEHTSVRAIQDANRGRIPDDPRQLPVGATLLIP